MTPELFCQKLVEVIGKLKAPAVIIIFVIALVKVLAATFIGAHDKRELFATVVTLMIMASLLFYVDRFVLWISTFIGR